MAKKPLVPGLSNITIDEFAIMGIVLKDLTPESALDIIQGIDDALSIQKLASIHNREGAKRRFNKKKAKDIIHDRLMQCEFIYRDDNQSTEVIENNQS